MQILLAYNQPVYRLGLIDLLSTMPGIATITEANSYTESCEFASQNCYDLIFLDVEELKINTPGQIDDLFKKSCRTTLIINSHSKDESFLSGLSRSYNITYISKSCDKESMTKFIHCLLASK